MWLPYSREFLLLQTLPHSPQDNSNQTPALGNVSSPPHRLLISITDASPSNAVSNLVSFLHFPLNLAQWITPCASHYHFSSNTWTLICQISVFLELPKECFPIPLPVVLCLVPCSNLRELLCTSRSPTQRKPRDSVRRIIEVPLVPHPAFFGSRSKFDSKKTWGAQRGFPSPCYRV